MKREHGVVLPFVTLLILWLILNGTPATDIAVTLAGFVAATVITLVVAGGLCFLMQCATPRAITAALLHISPRTWARAISTAGSGGCLEGQVQVHRTQGKKHEGKSNEKDGVAVGGGSGSCVRIANAPSGGD